MNRRMSLCLACFSIFCILLSAQVSTLGPTDQRVADLIAQVKNMPVSKLDAALPGTSLEEWLKAQAGPEGKIGWVVRSVPRDTTHDSHGMLDWVEADATLKDGRTFFVVVDVSTDPSHPRVVEANVIPNKTEISRQLRVRRLSDLPRVLRKTSQNSDRSEAQR